MRMTLEEYKQSIDLLAAVHGEGHAVFTNPDISAIWYEFFATKCTAASFKQIMKWYLGNCHWMPKVPNDIYKAWIESGELRPPGEDWNAFTAKTTASLASSEVQEQVREKEALDSMTSEQMSENLLRFQLLYAIANTMTGISADAKKVRVESLATTPIHELQSILRTCKQQKRILSANLDRNGNIQLPKNSLLEDIKKYFHSGSEKYRQSAIDWAAKNGFELVKKNGQVVDIKKVEF